MPGCSLLGEHVLNPITSNSKVSLPGENCALQTQGERSFQLSSLHHLQRVLSLRKGPGFLIWLGHLASTWLWPDCHLPMGRTLQSPVSYVPLLILKLVMASHSLKSKVQPPSHHSPHPASLPRQGAGQASC